MRGYIRTRIIDTGEEEIDTNPHPTGQHTKEHFVCTPSTSPYNKILYKYVGVVNSSSMLSFISFQVSISKYGYSCGNSSFLIIWSPFFPDQAIARTAVAFF